MSARLKLTWNAVAFDHISGFACRVARFGRKNAGKIIYYACMIAALSAIAYAADIYRKKEVATEVMQGYAAEMQAAQTEEATPEFQAIVELMPEGAQLIQGFFEDMRWNAALNRWESHAAVDFAMENVYSLTDGRIVDCGTNGLYGGYVRIDAGEYDVLYASIEADPSLKIGAEVSTGDRIGSVDASMPGESYMGDHLHFEILLDGKKLNPETFDVEIDLMR